MNHTELNDLLTAYEVDVRFPDVSGIEQLDMLLNRSALADAERSNLLTVEQRTRLAEADRILAAQAVRFHRPSSASPTWRPGVSKSMRRPRTWWWIWTWWRSCRRRRKRSWYRWPCEEFLGERRTDLRFTLSVHRMMGTSSRFSCHQPRLSTKNASWLKAMLQTWLLGLPPGLRTRNS